MVEVIGLSKQFKSVKAVDNISFNVSQGEILGLLGENGAGKTTTLRMLATMLKPTSGTVNINNYDVVNEALFAAAMDRLQPMLSNYYSDGGTWKKFDVSKEDIYKRIAPVEKASDELWKFTKNMIEDAFEKGFISKE